MGESSVSDVRVGYAKYKFKNADTRKETSFTKQSIIGCTLNLEQAIQIFVVSG